MTVAAPSIAREAAADIQRPAAMRRALVQAYRTALSRFHVLSGGVLARSIVRAGAEWRSTEADPLHTADAIKALVLLERHGIASDLDPRSLTDTLVRDHLVTADVQVLALALWAAAFGGHAAASQLFNALRTRLTRNISQSMTLGWTLAALSEYRRAGGDRTDVEQLARHVFLRLTANQDRSSSLFYASARREGWLRRRPADTTLSSHTYPILGLALFADVFGSAEARSRAEACAARLCALQGPLGQWWRRFDSTAATVLVTYPVYVVNHDGAIPAALGALQRSLGDRRYDEVIARGLAWEFGQNELATSLVDVPSGVVARGIDNDAGKFVVDRELYLYQPARCLYAVLSDDLWRAEVLA